MAYRFRAHIHFTQDLAQWCRDQVAQRLAMAFHINRGKKNEERSENSVVNAREWTCNVFVPDESKAILEDFWAHMMTQTTRMRTVTTQAEDGTPMHHASYMDLHYCFNDVSQPCHEPYLTFSTPLPSADDCLTAPVWTQSDLALYVVGFRVKHNNKIWEAKNVTHTWIAPAATGDGAISWTWIKDCGVVTPEPQPQPEPPPVNPCAGVAAWSITQHWLTYKVGDLRTDGGKLWRCINPQWAQNYAPSSSWGHLAWEFVANCS